MKSLKNIWLLQLCCEKSCETPEIIKYAEQRNGFLNLFDYNNKPILRTVLAILTVATTKVFAFLILVARSPEVASAEAIAASNPFELED